MKSITNKVEMLSADKPNAKALHELVLYRYGLFKNGAYPDYQGNLFN